VTETSFEGFKAVAHSLQNLESLGLSVSHWWHLVVTIYPINYMTRMYQRMRKESIRKYSKALIRLAFRLLKTPQIWLYFLIPYTLSWPNNIAACNIATLNPFFSNSYHLYAACIFYNQWSGTRDAFIPLRIPDGHSDGIRTYGNAASTAAYSTLFTQSSNISLTRPRKSTYRKNIMVGPHEVFKQIIRCYFCSFRLKVLFWGPKRSL